MPISDAIEEQTVPVAIAEMVCKLNTCYTLRWVVNPKAGKRPTEIGMFENAADDAVGAFSFTVDLAAPFLSRIDVILKLVQYKND